MSITESFQIKSNNIKFWPLEDQPREKLIRNGEHAMSNTELLAILLKNAAKGESALDLARKMIKKFGTLRNLSSATYKELKEFKGLGNAKFAQIKAAIEIGKRLIEETANESRVKIDSAKKAIALLMPRMRDLKKEVFKVIFLNAKSEIINIVETTQGTVNHVTPIIREIFEEALKYHASSIICIHNHPSGDPKPSQEDTLFTKHMINAGNTLQITVLDHIIIGNNNYFSFQETGKLRFSF